MTDERPHNEAAEPDNTVAIEQANKLTIQQQDRRAIESTGQVTREPADDITVYRLNDRTTELDNGILKELVNSIIVRLGTVQAIYYLGRMPVDGGKLFFVVVISKEDIGVEQRLWKTIIDICAKIAPVIALIGALRIVFFKWRVQ